MNPTAVYTQQERKMSCDSRAYDQLKADRTARLDPEGIVSQLLHNIVGSLYLTVQKGQSCHGCRSYNELEAEQTASGSIGHCIALQLLQ